MEEEATPPSKAELLERTQQEYDKLDRALAGLSEAQISASPDGDWSIKDLLAHIAAWQQILLRFHVGKQPFAEAAPGIGVDYASSDVDTINDALYTRDRDRSLADVLDTFRRSHQQMIATIEGMTDQELYAAYTPPGRDQGGQLIDWIVGDAYEHYAEHRETIEKRARA
ncbi:MAG TPA: ClbS/DfsB family four-helix bundle protein [Roseiflexaceae bacterium]|nr:ClbS/DfsB family four-helix bundle protein [Roseiflexaceae bacterium]